MGKPEADPFGKFSKEEIGFGGRFRRGRGTDFDRRGLAGAFRELQDRDNPEGKNLSAKDVGRFSKLLSERMKAKDSGSSGFDRAERVDLLRQVKDMHRSGKISSSDAEDFGKIIDRLSA